MTAPDGRSTTSVHGHLLRRQADDPVVQPVYQTTTYVNAIGSDREVLYARYGNTPNQLAVSRKYAMLEGSEAGVVVGSGMAATALAHLAVLRPGDHLIASSWIYGGTRKFFDEELGRFNISVSYVDPAQHRGWRRAIRKNTRAIFFESPTNPTMRVIDPAPVAQIATETGIALLVDSTFASPINFRPLQHGADIVITSGTKYLNGHSDVTAGLIASTKSYIDEVVRPTGCGCGPQATPTPWPGSWPSASRGALASRWCVRPRSTPCSYGWRRPPRWKRSGRGRSSGTGTSRPTRCGP
jgi:cystathionine beta-lyase/cystathionine gamma-synthase